MFRFGKKTRTYRVPVHKTRTAKNIRSKARNTRVKSRRNSVNPKRTIKGGFFDKLTAGFKKLTQ